MQFYVEKAQSWNNVCIVRCEFLCGKYQCHQPRLLCLKMYQTIRKWGDMQRRVGLEFELDFELQFELNLIKPHFCQKQSGNTTKNY